MKLIRYNTAVTLLVGPILGTDFLTPQTSVTLATGHAELFQAGANAAIDISGRTFTHISNGVYSLALLASDVGVLGPLLIHLHAASTMPLKVDANVLSQAAWDALMAGGNMPANVAAINGSASAASDLGSAALGVVPLTVGNGSSSTLIATNLTQATSSFYNGRTLVFTSGALAGQATTITAYNGATKQLTVNQLTGAPAANDTAVIV